MARSSRNRHAQWTISSVVAMTMGITLLHYLTNTRFITYHAIYRSLYYLPIIVAALMLGVRGGVRTSLTITAVYVPYVLLFQQRVPGRLVDSLLEVLLFNGVAVVTGVLADGQRRRQQQADVLMTYINDVLTSLPVGVATVQGNDGDRTPRNPVAADLLRGLEDPQQLPVNTGYYEVSLNDRPIGVHCSPLHATDGSAIGHVFVLEDLSEHHRLAEQIHRAERVAALGQLAGGLAHEVRNPLGIVRATAQLLATKLSDRAELTTYTTVLTAETDRIERLIGELLAYANPRSPTSTAFAPAALIDDLVTACRPYAMQHDVMLEYETAPNLPLLHADREQIRQALLNLVLNAVQASARGQTVHISCSVIDRQICFRIIDRGAGIPPAIRRRIFDPFFTTRTDGAGMGLAMVARIVADHRGSVDVQNVADGGTEAAVCLPIGRGEAHE